MDVTQDVKYLRLLAQSFPTIAAASTEIINLQAILNLPKGTEHFLADIHGEHEAFRHVLKNAFVPLAQYLPYILFDLTVNYHSPLFRCKHYMVLTSPRGMA